MPLEKDGEVTVPSKRWGYFNRKKYSLVAKDTDRLNKILNHFRVFSVQTFKNIPKFSMCNMYG